MENNLILDEKYIIKNKISFGGTAKVYLVEDIKKSTLFACKILETENDFFKNEINILSQISHKNIVNIIDSGEGKIKGKNNKNYFYIILDYCENQTLFNYIYFYRKGFGESFGKYIFNIILDTVNDIHNLGFAHRDLKTENILLDKNFNIKISDFGFSASLEDKEGNKKKLTTILGTLQFLAPEMIEKKNYDGKKADIYALGILLLAIVSGKYIFYCAKKTDENYSLIYKKNYKEFCSKFEKLFKDFNYSKEFIDLFINMIKYNPNERFNYNEIKNHVWMKNIEINNEKMIKEFKRRDFYVRSRIDDENEEITSENNNEENNENVFRNENNLKSFYSNENKIKIIDENKIKNILKIKFSINIQNEVNFMNLITNLIFNNENKNINQSQKNLSFKIIYENDDFEEEEEDENNEFEIENLVIKIELVKNNKKNYYFLFKKKSGDLEQFLQKTEKIKKIIKNYIIKNY